jgi:hypothetical protein
VARRPPGPGRQRGPAGRDRDRDRGAAGGDRLPGPIGRLFSSTIYDGTVAVDADGRPADEAKLGARTCAELAALADGDRSEALACTDRGAACGERARTLAQAVDVLTHESWQLYGVRDEADTECRSLQTMAWAAQELGATEPEARRLALLQFEVNFPMLPARYRSSACHDGGAADTRPDDPRWP